MSTRAEPSSALEKDWWLRAVAVLQSPRAVFAALRDDSEEAASARQEPLLAIVWLAGIAAILSTTAAARILDDYQIDDLVLAIWAFLAGGIYGIGGYWLGGGAVYLGARGAGSEGSYRQARHLLGLAAAPLALSLLAVWPVRLAIYGADLFRTGGGDHGLGDDVFRGLVAAFGAWAVVLLLLGVRTVHGWSWGRSLAAVSLAAVVLVLFGLVPIVL